MSIKSSFHKSLSVLTAIFLLLVSLPVSTALADSAGPNNPAVGTNVTGAGTEPWIEPGNITIPGEPFASVTLYHLHLYSNYLQGTQYGFAIPPDATIIGIEVAINRMDTGNNPSIVDDVVRLVKAGMITGDNKALATTWPSNFTTAIYGGSTDLWGTDWTPADINALDFGVVLAAARENNGNNSRTAIVDTMQITVYYEYTSATSVECGDGNPVAYGDSVTCVATVSRLVGDQTPTGTVAWSTDVSGLFGPNPCTLTGSGGVATCSVSFVPTAVGGGVHTITGAYSGDNIFSPSSGQDTLDVIQRPVTVTPDDKSKEYTDPDPELTYQITEGSLVFGDTFTGMITRDPGEDIGMYAIVQGTLALSENYALTFIDGTFTITPRFITVTADPQTKVYGQSDPTFTYQVTSGSLLVGDTFTGTLTREPGEAIGMYPILQGTLSLPAYYDLTFVSDYLTITGTRILLPIITK